MNSMQTNPRSKNHSTRQDLVKELRSAIESRECQPGQMLPTEAELMEKYGLSRYNVRMAMLELVNEGLVTRTPGQGSVVTRRKTKSRRISLVVQEPREWLAAGIAHGLVEVLRESNIRTELVACGDEQEEFDQAIESVVESDCDGLVVNPLPWLKNHEWAFRLKQAGVPFVVTESIGGVQVNAVGVDNFLGGQLAANHLIEQGYRRLYVVSPEVASTSVRRRMDGFLGAVSRSKQVQTCLPVLFPLEHSDKAEHERPWLTSQRVWAEYGKQLDTGEPIGVFAISDFEAYGVCQACKELGLRIGPDVGVVGFDDRELARVNEPPLTTVRNTPEEVGRRAGQILLRQFENPEMGLSMEVIQPELVVRESTLRGV